MGGEIAVDLAVVQKILGEAQEVFGHDPEMQIVRRCLLRAQQERLHSVISRCSSACQSAYRDLSTFKALSSASKLGGLLESFKTQPVGACTDSMVMFVQRACETCLSDIVTSPDDMAELVALLPLCIGWCPNVELNGSETALGDVCELLQALLNSVRSSADLTKMVAARLPCDDCVAFRTSLQEALELEFFNTPVGEEAVAEVHKQMGAVLSVAREKHWGDQQVVCERLVSGDLSQRAGGGDAEDAPWTVGLAENASLRTVILHAMEGLLQVNGSEIEKLSEEARVACTRFWELNTLYGHPMSVDTFPDWLSRAASLARLGRATVVTALVLGHMKQHHANPIKLKSLVEVHIASARQDMMGQSAQPLIHATVWKAAQDACSMTLAWPKDV